MYLGNSAAPLGKKGNSSLADWVEGSWVEKQEQMKMLCCFPRGMTVFSLCLEQYIIDMMFGQMLHSWLEFCQ